MFLSVTHRTRYEYPAPATSSLNEVRLMPATDETQRCLEFSIAITPPTPVFSYADIGGMVHHFNIREPHRLLDIVAKAQVETLLSNPYEGLDETASDLSYYGTGAARAEVPEFLLPSRYVELSRAVDEFAPPRPREGSTVKFLLDLNTYLYDSLEYDRTATNVHSTVDEVLAQRAGVCQDFAHLMVACCRLRDIPTRYVSGYLYGGDGLRGEIGSHAWVECRLPDGHWLALDPTNHLLANDHYIRVHVGRDYSDVSPTRGVYVGPPASKMEFGVTVVETRPANARG